MTKTFRNRWKAAMRKAAASMFFTGLTLCATWHPAPALAEETASLNDDEEYYTNANLDRANLQPAVTSTQPTQETSFEPAARGDTFVSFALPDDLTSWDQQNNNNTVAPTRRLDSGEGIPTVVILGYNQAIMRDSRDVGSLMFESPQTTGVSYFRRPVATNLYVRGYNSKMLQTQMNGQTWCQARPDQDTIVSKIDSGIVSNVVVVPGPYSAMYGPGAAFIDVSLMPTIRSSGEGQVVSQYRTLASYDTNAVGYYAREAIDLGGVDYGLRANFGFRGASDYRAGNGERFNASYQWRDIDLALSKDFADGSTFDFQYLRVDIDDAELYGQPFNMDFGVTNGFMGRYQTQSSGLADNLLVESWYNQTQVGTGRDTVVVGVASVLQPVQQTYGNSFGGRVINTYGDVDGDNTKVGVDFRGIKNALRETDTITTGAVSTMANFDLPNSEYANPGLLFQREVKDDDLTIRYGGRYDYVQTNPGDPRPGSGAVAGSSQRNFDLLSGFVTSELALNDVWSANASIGHGQRAPTLFELYAFQPFVAGNQHGFTYFEGTAQLNEEKITQVDLGITGEYADARFMARAYYSQVEDYVTVSWLPTSPVFLATNGYKFVNSDSYFTGVEFNSEYDINDNWAVFANGSYTYGQDDGLFGGPVFGVYPFQSRTGIRLESGDADRGYGMEFAGRLVAAQNRIADGDRGVNLPVAEERATPGFGTMDLRGYFRPQRNLTLTGGVTNLADRTYFEHFDYRNPGSTATPQNLSGRVLQVGTNFYMGVEWIY